MKKFLKFSGIIAAVIAIVSFILLMCCHSVVYSNGGTSGWYSGISALFGGGTALVGAKGSGWSISTGAQSVDAKLAWTALVGWILIIVALVILIAGIILPLLKVHALDKFAGILNLVAVLCLVVAGILIFVTLPVFAQANEWSNADGWGLGAGWIIAGILAIVGGVVAILPAAFDFVGSKK